MQAHTCSVAETTGGKLWQCVLKNKNAMMTLAMKSFCIGWLENCGT
jgi:hypothetical protein